MQANSILPLLWLAVLLHVLATWWAAVRRGRRARALDAQDSQLSLEDAPAVSIIVPAWNERGTIERNIGALQRIDYPCWEAVIVAGGDDDTFAAARDTAAGDDRIRVLRRGPEPKNAALNRVLWRRGMRSLCFWMPTIWSNRVGSAR